MKPSSTPFFNRELSWLAFNQRVLDRAMDAAVPLLERIKFLAISASNLDEFFMVRVGGLKIIEGNTNGYVDPSGLTAAEQLSKIRDRVLQMNRFQSDCLLDHLEPELTKHGICRLLPEDLSESQRKQVFHRFRSETMSTIAPIAIDPREGFPLLGGTRLCICIRLKNLPTRSLQAIAELPSASTVITSSDSTEATAPVQERFLLIPLGKSIDRFWAIPGDLAYQYMLIEDVIGMFLDELLPGQQVLEWTTLRVTRNGDVALYDDGRADLMHGIQAVLDARKRSDCVRLNLSESASQSMRQFLMQKLNINEAEVYPMRGPLGLTDFFHLANLSGFRELKDEPWPAIPSPDFPSDQTPFEVIAAGDRMLHQPFQTYDPVVQFLQSAAEDPLVIAIKQTLYRTSSDSAIVTALERAAKNGKHVTAIVELKARFDEARNITRARELEDAGVDVVYGVAGLKTHAKCCIVVRKEQQGIRRYVHFSTGNYNEATARLYGDISFFSCDEQLGDDAVRFFNAITGLSLPQAMTRLTTAPIDMRENLLNLIEVEKLNAVNTGEGAIVAKLNSLVDPQIIESLYDASQAGVKIRLNVRGICCLVPGLKGISDNIQVTSIIDRYLEHSRIFYFKQAGDEKVFISSADWMVRNLDRRIELMIPIIDAQCKARLIKILKCYFQDNSNAHLLQPDSTYIPATKKRKKQLYRSQYVLYQEAIEYHQKNSKQGDTVFRAMRNQEAE